MLVGADRVKVHVAIVIFGQDAHQPSRLDLSNGEFLWQQGDPHDGAATFATAGLPSSLLSSQYAKTNSGLTYVGLGVLPTQSRLGSTVKADWDINSVNSLQVGGWYDYLRAKNQIPAFNINADGTPASTDSAGVIRAYNGQNLYRVSAVFSE